ncbi:hypothetical protein K438DRAFT_1846552 [Mycena galopus ATCC 62051]|nr:hypothetical protein K438DRAFT_1846552 [Mycena galopus ATCC 62051]
MAEIVPRAPTELTVGSAREDSGPTPPGPAIFSGGRGFTVSGGTFSMSTTTNHVHSTPPPVPRDFTKMLLRDIWDLHQLRRISISNPGTVTLGAVMFCSSSDRQDPSEVAVFPKIEAYINGTWAAGVRETKITEEGWTRYAASDVSDKMLTLHRSIPTVFDWLIQANYVFSRLGITSNFEDYILMHSIDFEIFVSAGAQEPPAGFLFLCPPENFNVTPLSFCWPDGYFAYWSLDPSGVDRLSPEKAANLGFPLLEYDTRILGVSWDSSVYAGLRQYLEARAFDPDTQDFPRRNNYQLVRLSNRLGTPHANVGPTM